MRRPPLLAAAAVVLGVVVGGVIWLFTPPAPPPGASAEVRLYYAHCSECHGVDGHGSWRSTLFLVHPGDLPRSAGPSGDSDQYLFDIIKHGGSPIGRPGMPAFGSQLSDADIRTLVAYLRRLARHAA